VPLSIHGVYKKDTKTKEKQKIKEEEEHPKNPKDSRKVTSNPQLLASNPTGTHTPSIEINRAF
jgi:hypothetical protein